MSPMMSSTMPRLKVSVNAPSLKLSEQRARMIYDLVEEGRLRFLVAVLVESPLLGMRGSHVSRVRIGTERSRKRLIVRRPLPLLARDSLSAEGNAETARASPHPSTLL